MGVLGLEEPPPPRPCRRPVPLVRPHPDRVPRLPGPVAGGRVPRLRTRRRLPRARSLLARVRRTCRSAGGRLAGLDLAGRPPVSGGLSGPAAGRRGRPSPASGARRRFRECGRRRPCRLPASGARRPRPPVVVRRAAALTSSPTACHRPGRGPRSPRCTGPPSGLRAARRATRR